MRGILFATLFYSLLTVLALLAIPFLLIPGRTALMVYVRGICAVMLGLYRVVAGVKVDYRGFDTLPKDRAYIHLAKHMSYLDVFATFWKRPDLTALAKRELFRIPIIGWVFNKLDIVPIERGKGTAKDQMPKVIAQVVGQKRPLLVYPEGTRTKPGERRALKAGAYYLQQDGRLDIYPVATNSGVHWGKKEWQTKPGTVVIEVGSPFPHGISREDFMALVNERVIYPSDRLMQDLDGLTPPDGPAPDAGTLKKRNEGPIAP